MGTSNHPQAGNQRLGSWKEIAAFFDCDERTLRRWEKERGLPVHRTPGGTGGKVFAYTDELSAWLAAPRNTAAALPKPNGHAKANGTSAQVAFIDGRLPLERSLSVEPSVQPGPLTRPHPRSGTWKIAGLAALVVLVVAAVTLALLYRSPAPDSIAVLPFTNVSGDANTDYLSDGFTESLIGNLAHVPRLKVKSRNSVFFYKGKQIDARQVGNDLGVSAVVTGRIVQTGDAIEVSAELSDVRDNTEIWGQRYRGKVVDLIQLQQQIAGDIADRLHSRFSASEKQRVTRQGTQNPEAYDLYLKGRYAWNNRTYGELEKAISYFNQAIAKDPGYAQAYSGLADCYSVLPNFGGNQNEDFPKSNGAARKALELDPTLAHPHAVLGSNQMQYDWDFAGGEAEFKKSFELDPNDATARQWYADDIAMIGGREQEAVDEVNRAHELEPQSSVISRVVGSVYVWNRQFDEAHAVCTRLTVQDPTFAIAHDCLAQVYWGKKNYAQVIEEWRLFSQLSGYQNDADFAAVMAQGFHSAGWKGAVDQAVAFRQEQRKTGYYSAFIIATFYADLGDKEQAFRWLNIAYREHDWLLISLKTNFRLDSIRSDPRFDELVRKVGLPQ